MSRISISNFLGQSSTDKKARTLKLFVSKVLSTNTYLVLDEKSHCKLVVPNEVQISNGRFVKITFCHNDGSKILATSKSSVFNCSPFKCVQLTPEISSLYSVDNSGSTDDKLQIPTSLKNIDVVAGKVKKLDLFSI
jgi:hypothetical protein